MACPDLEEVLYNPDRENVIHATILTITELQDSLSQSYNTHYHRATRLTITELQYSHSHQPILHLVTRELPVFTASALVTTL